MGRTRGNKKVDDTELEEGNQTDVEKQDGGKDEHKEERLDVGVVVK